MTTQFAQEAENKLRDAQSLADGDRRTEVQIAAASAIVYALLDIARAVRSISK